MKTISINNYIKAVNTGRVNDIKFFSKAVGKVTAMAKIKKLSEYKKTGDKNLVLVTNAGHRDEIIGFSFDALPKGN